MASNQLYSRFMIGDDGESVRESSEKKRRSCREMKLNCVTQNWHCLWSAHFRHFSLIESLSIFIFFSYEKHATINAWAIQPFFCLPSIYENGHCHFLNAIIISNRIRQCHCIESQYTFYGTIYAREWRENEKKSFLQIWMNPSEKEPFNKTKCSQLL